MIIPATIARRSSSSPTDSHQKNLIIISTVLGSALILAIVLTAVLLWSRKRARKLASYREACLRDPNLTWDDYERRRKLSRSILIWEEEVQRDIILRKTLQSRTSFSIHTKPTTPPSPPRHAAAEENAVPVVAPQHLPARHARLSRDVRGAPGRVRPGVEGYRGLLRTDLADPDGQATPVDRRRKEALTRKGSSDEPPTRPPTALLRQPSLWAHPAFRGLVRSNTKHSSLPATVGRP
ncbi:uncharacterized protein PG998_013288 [Apiospora kogelbergensis]|uniref:uncharacterized protein n=1 Tax=Apiospora kogelbergensis TaxID=1337665 RepID=UPI0031307077